MLFTEVTVFGLRNWNWNWGSSHSFHSTAEGWFGLNTENGGADKLGHAFSGYLITNGLAEQLLRQGRSPKQAALTSALNTQALLTYVEIYDGYSVNHGWSMEDLVMNMVGSGAAYLRQATPGLRDKLDFRLEYQPSGYKGFSAITDYAGQKYVLTVKLSGFNELRNTSWRYVELQTGYYTRGFSRDEQARGQTRSRHSFVGIGLNWSELLFGQRANNEAGARRGGRLFFEHIQVPYTATRSEW